MNNSSYYHETVKDKLTLSPIDKYIKHNRYPYKMLLSILLVILTTLSTFNLLNIFSISGKSQIEVWKTICDFDGDNSGMDTLLNIDEFKDHLATLIKNFKNIENMVFQNINMTLANYNIIVFPKYPISDFELDRKNKPKEIDIDDIPSFYHNNYTYNFNISTGIITPFNASSTSSIKKFIQRIDKFKLSIHNIVLKVATPNGVVDYQTCWDIDIFYMFHESAYIKSSFKPSFYTCSDLKQNEDDNDDSLFDNEEKYLNEYENPDKSKGRMLMQAQLQYTEKFLGDSIISLHLAILILSCISLILNFKYIYEIMQIYLETIIRSKQKKIWTESINLSDENDNRFSYEKRNQPQKAEKTIEDLLQKDKPWFQLTFREKMLFFDFWFIFGIIGNFIQIWSSNLALVNELGSVSNDRNKGFISQVLIGFSCFFAWFNMIRFLEYNKSIFNISNILRRSLPQMAYFIIGFVPIFLAYVFLGISLFWRFEKFKDANEATMSLFSLIMGDSIFNFVTTIKSFKILNYAYFYSFLIVFFMAIQNIFVSIICSKAREKEKEEIQQPIDLNNNQINITEPSIEDEFGNKKFVFKVPEKYDWNKNPPNRMQTMSPKNSLDNNSPLMTSQALKKMYERKISLNTSIRPDMQQLYGAITNIPLKKYTNENFKNLGRIELEKARIQEEICELSNNFKQIFNDMKKDFDDLEIYKLKFEEKIQIKQQYHQEIENIDLIIRKILNKKELQESYQFKIV